MGLSPSMAEEIYRAARVHDVGKIGILSTTLFKDGALNDEEWREMRSHPDVGARLIGKFPEFSLGMEIVRHHHERWDGRGYPAGLAGSAIPLGARIVAVTDTFDAMTSSRAYRRALPIDVVLAELERCRGKQFDPRPLDAFLEVLYEQPQIVQHTESVSGPRQILSTAS
jgi:HD-GYP domain-containing protein (c-di-GMP phosphodiesterase class II)